MAFIDVVEWRTQDNKVFAYRFPHTNLSTATQLIVYESQEAVFFSKGQIIGKFGPGKHTLSTENLPLLRSLYGIPFGGKNPFTAEVWYVNKTAPLDIDWITTTMRFMDPDYNQMLPLIAKGRYGLKIIDAERFLVQLVGTMNNYDAHELTEHFKGAMIAKTNSSILSFMNANRIGINSISAYLDELSNFIKQPMSEFWEGYGFNLAGFYITDINIDMNSPEGQKISEALSQRSAQGIAGYTWQQQQSFNVANNAANSGSSMGILGVAMMTGAFAGNGGVGSAMMQPQMGQQQNNNQAWGDAQGRRNMRKEAFCSNCGKKFSVDSAFCPYCGNKYNPCPACGADNPEKASRCVVCGTYFQKENVDFGSVCSNCNAPVQPGTKFCPKCGNRL